MNVVSTANIQSSLIETFKLREDIDAYFQGADRRLHVTMNAVNKHKTTAN